MRPIGAGLIGLGILLFGFLAVSDYLLFSYREGPPASTPAGDVGIYYYTGAIHCHSRYSDGSGSPGDIAEAASRAGCDFVIISDHNTLAPRRAGEEGYRSGVLVLCDQEVSTPAGHLLVLDCYRQIAAAEFVSMQALVDSINAWGGMVFLAHPFLERRPWTDWSLNRITGFELLNADAEWRNDGALEIVRALLFLRLFPTAAFNGLVDRPDRELELLDRSPSHRPYVTIAAADAHARIRLTGSRIIPFPSYESVFRLVQTCIITHQPLTGRLESDRRLIYDALRSGRCYAAFSGLGDARGLDFRAVSDGGNVLMGGRLEAARDPVRIEVGLRTDEPLYMELFCDGDPVAASDSTTLSYAVSGPGLYRLEVFKMRKDMSGLFSIKLPWIFSSPIRIDPAAEA